MVFRTALPPFLPPFFLSEKDAYLCVGSCFAENLGEKLRRTRFYTLVNPSGIVFNPASIRTSLEMLQPGYTPAESDLFFHQGRWNSYFHHSRFSGVEKEPVWQGIREAAERGRAFLEKTTVLILTLGTASVFIHREMGLPVANCHKLPAAAFNRVRLSVGEIVDLLQPALEALPGHIRAIISVSPVRYLRDGLVENQRSKATLLLAAEALCGAHPNRVYFPAYELVIDDLRDYRFFKEDMAHPSDQAVQYVWEYFSETFFQPPTREIIREMESFQTALDHRPLFPGSPQYADFQEKTGARRRELQEKFPFLNWMEQEG